MEFRKVLALRGPNVWAMFPVLEAWVDLGEYNETSSEEVPGFNERLMSWLPTMIEHRCSVGERGGFFERLRRGTYPAHILEHVTLELQSLAGTEVGYGRARATSEDRVYKVAIEYKDEDLARAALYTARELVLAAIHDRPFDLAAEVQKLRDLAHEVCLGPSTKAIVEAAQARGIPVRRLNKGSLVQLGYGVKQRRILTAETDATGAIAEWIAQDKEMTRALLRSIGVPVPEGRPVTDADDAWAAAQEIKTPVVVKPQHGNHGRGVTTNLTTRQQVLSAYDIARAEGNEVLVERFAPGDDYRLLVVGNRLVAAARREPAHVIGDGRSTVQQLVDEVNSDPRRSDGHATVLSKIPLDAVSLQVLAEQGHTLHSVPHQGAKVLIRRTANLSTGGTATDVTDQVHPEVAARAVEAARVVGLDIAGVDIVALDIGRPMEEQRAVVVEVNAGPGLRMHLEPTAGTPRAVGQAIVDLVYGPGETGRIPVVGVTGTNGKTTTTRLLAHMFRTQGKCVGMTCTDGIYINDRRIDTGDCSGPKSARNVLLNPQVEAAVLETARGGIVREGLGYDRCDVGIVTNIAEGDHLGLADINTAEDLAKVKRCVIEAVTEEGYGVLNAADPLTVAMARHCPGKVIFFALDEKNEVIIAHRQAGGRAVLSHNDQLVLAEGDHEIAVCRLSDIPITLGGLVGFQVENALAAAAAAWGAGLPLEAIREGLRTFEASTSKAPGRFNILNWAGATVVLDYGHNTGSLTALVDTFARIPHRRRLAMYTVAGDRRDEDVIRQGEIMGDEFDEVITYEDKCTRGRKDGEVTALFRQGLARGKRISDIIETRGELVAVEMALGAVRASDLLLIQVDQIDETLRFVQEHIAQNEPIGEGIMSLTEEGSSLIEVREGRLGKSVHAAHTIEKGAVVLQGWGPRVPERTRHSFQVDHDTHIVINSPIELINHSCEPNCGVVVRRDAEVMEIHALRRIEAGEELYTDYSTFEYDIQFMNGPCLCGTSSCRGRITGYKDLPTELRVQYAFGGPYIADYLQEIEPVLAVVRSGQKAGV